MSNRLLIMMILLLLSAGIRAQLPVEKLFTVPGNYLGVTIDNLQNIYLLNQSNQLKKLNEKGDSIAVYNDVKKFGEASLLDITNPMRILIYYKNFATLVMLDRLLNPVNTLDLRKQNIFNAEAVGLSYDNKVWVFDNMENVLKKLDDKGTVLMKTPDFRQLFDETIAPAQIFDRNQLVYIYDTARGIYSFDYYGAYKGRIPITQWQNLRITDKYIYGNDQNRFYRYTLKNQRFEEWPVAEELKKARRFLFDEGRIYSLSDSGMVLYRSVF